MKDKTMRITIELPDDIPNLEKWVKISEGVYAKTLCLIESKIDGSEPIFISPVLQRYLTETEEVDFEELIKEVENRYDNGE